MGVGRWHRLVPSTAIDMLQSGNTGHWSKAAACIPAPPGTLKLLPNPVLKGVMEHLLSLESNQPRGPLSVLLGVEALVGQVKN